MYVGVDLIEDVEEEGAEDGVVFLIWLFFEVVEMLVYLKVFEVEAAVVEDVDALFEVDLAVEEVLGVGGGVVLDEGGLEEEGGFE